MPDEPLHLAAAAELLPLWVRWGGLLATIAISMLAAGVGGGAAAIIALWRVRRLGDAPWPERARLVYVGRHAILGSVTSLALVCSSLGWIFAGPFSVAPRWVLTLVGGVVGMAVALCWARYVAQRVRNEPLPLRQAVRSGTSAALLFVSPALALLGGLALMPTELGRDAYLAVVLVGLALLALSAGGPVVIGRALGVVRPADERLMRVVDRVAGRLGVPVRAVYEIDWAAANAFALPIRGWLIFTRHAVALLSDEQLEAVTAHELGHLSESRGVVLLRLLRVLLVAPLIMLVPLVAGDGPIGMLYVFGPIFALAYLFAWFSRRLEARADTFSHDYAGEGVYAATLETLHRANLAPVVLGGGASHPDLYDRMLAAGVTPSYARPQRPPRVVGLAALAAALVLGGGVVLAAVLSVGFVSRQTGDTARLHTALLFDRSRGHAGTIARLADLRVEHGDGVAAATLYRTAAQMAGTKWSAAAYRAAALAAGDRCPDAQRLLEVADGVFGHYDGHERPAALIAAHDAVRLCAARLRSL